MLEKKQSLFSLILWRIPLQEFITCCLVVCLLFSYVTSKAEAIVFTTGISADYKLTYKSTDTDEILFQSDDFASMWLYINSHPIDGPKTLQFNTSDVFLLDETLYFAFNNNGHLFTVKAAEGQKPVVDVQLKSRTVLSCSMSDVRFENLTLRNADPNDASGCIVRHGGNTRNVTYRNIKVVRGWCGMRATTNITNLTIDGWISEEVSEGALRLGDGGVPERFDMFNLIVKNVYGYDSLDGAVISGTASKSKPYLLLKKADGLLVENVFLDNGLSCGLGSFEKSRNVVLKNMMAGEFGAGSGVIGIHTHENDGISLINCFVKSKSEEVGKSIFFSEYDTNVSLLHNSFIASNVNDVGPNLKDVKRITEIAGCIFKTSNNNSVLSIGFNRSGGYNATLATDFLAEHDNVFVSSGEYFPYIGIIGLAELNGGDYTKISHLGGISPSSYQRILGRGQNSRYTLDGWKVTFERRTNKDASLSPEVYLSDNSFGRNMIAKAVAGISVDLTGKLRSVRTDAGAYDRDSDLPVSPEDARDTTPDQFSFPDFSGVTPNETIETAGITISGIDSPTLVSISGGEYSKNGQAFTTEEGSVSEHDVIKIRGKAASGYSTAVYVTLVVGGIYHTSKITTIPPPPDQIPDQFVFFDKNDVELDTYAESNEVEITGINTGAPVSISGGEYSINGNPFTLLPGTVYLGDRIKVRVLASTSYFTSASATITIGGVTGVFSARTISNIPPPEEGRFSLLKSEEDVVFKSNNLLEMMNFISSYNFHSDLRLRFNTSEIFTLNSPLNLNFNTHGFLFTIENKAGKQPGLDGGGILTSIINSSMSNLKFSGISLFNTKLSDNSAAIIKQTGGSNVVFDNLLLKYGNKAVYVSGGSSNITFRNIKVEEVVNGSFKIGNLSAAQPFDAFAITLQDIELKDNLSGGNIPGSAYPYKPFIELSKVDGAVINHITYSENFAGGACILANNRNITLTRVLASKFGKGSASLGLLTSNNNGITITNSYFLGADDGTDKTCWNSNSDQNIIVQHNTFNTTNNNRHASVNFNNAKLIKSVVGNIFLGTPSSASLSVGFATGGYTATLPLDFVEENNNVFLVDGVWDAGLGIFGLSELNAGGYTKVSINGGMTFSQYQSHSRGQNSVLVSDRVSKIAFLPEAPEGPAVYLSQSSIGRSHVSDPIAGLSVDFTGANRIYPTDAGAFDSKAFHNADLTGLSLDFAIISPAFAPETLTYTASVLNEIDSIQVTPSTNLGAALSVNGVSVISGSFVKVPLNVGENTLTIRVTAKDKVTHKDYTIVVTRAASNNARLSDLVVNSGILSPSFAEEIVIYSVSVPNLPDKLAVSAFVADQTASVKIAGASVSSGNHTDIPLSVGPNTIAIEVTAQDGTVKTYRLTAVRAPSSNASLSGISLSSGSLSPSFSADTLNYRVSLAMEVNTVNIIPAVEEPNAVVDINNTQLPSEIALSFSPDPSSTVLSINVTAEDAITRKSYRLAFTKKQQITLDELPAKIYGDADFGLTATSSSGLAVSYTSSNPEIAEVNGNTVTIHKAGEVIITAIQSGSDFYEPAAEVKRTLSIRKKALVVIAENKVKVYGDPNPPFTVTYEGLVEGEAGLIPPPMVRTNASELSGVGEYDIEVAGSSLNYEFSFVIGKLSVKKRELNVVANSLEKFQGSENPKLTFSYQGFVNGDDVSALGQVPVPTTIATTTSPLGDYPITFLEGAAANYSFNYIPGNLKVKPGAPTNISLTAARVAENLAPGAMVGRLVSTSDNPEAVFSYSLPQSKNDNNYFQIIGDEIRTMHSFNFELKSEYWITVRSTTRDGLFLEKDFTISIVDVNEAPSLAAIPDQTVCHLPEEQVIVLSGISAGEDIGQTVELSISSNANLFEILVVSGNRIRYRTKNENGTALVSVTVRDNGGVQNGGVNTFIRDFRLTVNSAPEVSVSSDRGLVISKGEEAVLTATGGTTYTWANSPGILAGQNTAALTIRPAQTTTYKVTAINANGCTVEREFTINVKEDFKKLVASNIMTPDGDGINDKLIIKNIDMYPNNILKVFDRAGRLVYSKRNYSNDWDGTFEGAPLAQDTYFYVVDFGPTVKEILKGFVTILRN